MQYHRDFAYMVSKHNISTRNEPLMKILLGSLSFYSSIRHEPLRFQLAILVPWAQKYATHRTVSRFEKLKHALVCEWPHRFSNGLFDPGFGIPLRTLMGFRLGDLVIGLFFSCACLFPFFHSGWAPALSQLTTLVSIGDVTNALPIRS